MGRPKKNVEVQTIMMSDGSEVARVTETTAKEESMEAEVISVLCPEDYELKKGRNVIEINNLDTDGCACVVTSTPDNIQSGLLVNNGMRLTNSDIVPVLIKGGDKIAVTIKIDDEVIYTEQQHGMTSVRTCFIPKGAHIANLMILN